MKYEKLCRDILSNIDRDNIKDVFHCVTRLRFVLKDKSKVDKEALAVHMLVKYMKNSVRLRI